MAWPILIAFGAFFLALRVFAPDLFGPAAAIAAAVILPACLVVIIWFYSKKRD